MEWKDISTAPKDGTQIVLFAPYSKKIYGPKRLADGYYALCYYKNNGWANWHKIVAPAFWMKLTSPIKESGAVERA